jgi:hypothetical protein
MKYEFEISDQKKIIPKQISTVKMKCAVCNACKPTDLKHACLFFCTTSSSCRLIDRCPIKPKNSPKSVFVGIRNITKANWKWAEVELSETGEIINVTEIEED